MSNPYMDEALTRVRLAEHGHRAVVGGMWEVIGPLQRDFLIAQGMQRTDRVLDIGCGALRGGAPLAAWLDAGGYYGIDISESLIEAGWREEIAAAGMADRLPRDHLHVTKDFEVPFGVTFDLGLAISLFTHLKIDGYQRCVDRMTPHFRPGGRIFATVFEGQGPETRHPAGVVSYPNRDPYHFTRDQLAQATPAGWTFDWIGDWAHPRDQQMIVLTRV